MADYHSEPKGGGDKRSFVFFTKMVDELVQFSDGDPELADGIRWLDLQAQRKGVSLYEMVFQVLYRHDLNERAKAWVGEKSAPAAGVSAYHGKEPLESYGMYQTIEHLGYGAALRLSTA